MKKHFRKIRKQFHQTMHPSHQKLLSIFGWYNWWHNQEYHEYIHYSAMIAGIILAMYFVMFDTIFSESTISNLELIVF